QHRQIARLLGPQRGLPPRLPHLTSLLPGPPIRQRHPAPRRPTHPHPGGHTSHHGIHPHRNHTNSHQRDREPPRGHRNRQTHSGQHHPGGHTNHQGSSRGCGQQHPQMRHLPQGVHPHPRRRIP